MTVAAAGVTVVEAAVVTEAEVVVVIDIRNPHYFSIRMNRPIHFMFYIRHPTYSHIIFTTATVKLLSCSDTEDDEERMICHERKKEKSLYCYKLSTGSMMPS